MTKRFVVLALSFLIVGCVGRGVETRTAKKPVAIRSQSGTQIPALGLAFDVSYDAATDGVIPSYRLLNVGITNNSLEIIPLDPLADRWWVVDRDGKKHDAIVGLRRINPDAWAQLPVGLKKLLEYPLMVPIGTTQPIDLLFPTKVKLNEFRAVVFRSVGLDRELEIYARD